MVETESTKQLIEYLVANVAVTTLLFSWLIFLMVKVTMVRINQAELSLFLPQEDISEKLQNEGRRFSKSSSLQDKSEDFGSFDYPSQSLKNSRRISLDSKRLKGLAVDFSSRSFL